MAVRNIRIIGDEILTKQCKPVREMTPRVKQLIGDMFDTMYDADGVGLAAPQVGVLKQVIVIDIEDGNRYVLINPKIVEASGTQTDSEGCLSVPGKAGKVTRPQHVRVSCLNENMEETEYEGEDLLARCFCHEIDHLSGHMYVDLVEGDLYEVSEEEDEAEEESEKAAPAGEPEETS